MNNMNDIREKLKKLQSKNTNSKNKVRPIPFNVDKIEILKGVPLKRRSGTPSKEDEMNIEVDEDFTYPLLEC